MFCIDLSLIFKVLGLAILSIFLLKIIKSALKTEFSDRPIRVEDVQDKKSFKYIFIWAYFIIPTFISAAVISLVFAYDYFLNSFIILSLFALPIVIRAVYQEIERVKKESL